LIKGGVEMFNVLKAIIKPMFLIIWYLLVTIISPLILVIGIATLDNWAEVRMFLKELYTLPNE